MIKNLLAYILCTLITVIPILKAGMFPGVMIFIMLASWALFVLCIIDSLFKPSQNVVLASKYKWSEFKGWAMVWIIYSSYLFIHLLIFPSVFDLNSFVLPQDGRDWDKYDLLRHKPIDIYAGIKQWAYFSSMWIIAFAASRLDKNQQAIILYTLLFASAFQICIGLYLHTSGNIDILGLWTKEYYLKDATGTFVNRNHFAGFLAMCWPLALAALTTDKPILLRSIKREHRLIVALIYSLLLVFALISSHSRMGLIAALFGLSVYLALQLKSNFTIRKKRYKFKFVATFLALLLFVLWFGIDDIVNRFLTLGEGDGRYAIWSSMFEMPFQGWVIGAGPGAFHDLYLLLQPDITSKRINFAHNDYLEFIFEFGLIGTTLLLAAVFYWSKHLISKKPLLENSGLKFGLIGSISAMAMHSLVDFNLQIPANAIVFWIALGITVSTTNKVKHNMPI